MLVPMPNTWEEFRSSYVDRLFNVLSLVASDQSGRFTEYIESYGFSVNCHDYDFLVFKFPFRLPEEPEWSIEFALARLETLLRCFEEN